MTPPPFEVAEPFRANLRSLRRLSGLNQEQLAFRASLHRTAIGLMERGERIPRIDTLVRLAARSKSRPTTSCRGSSGCRQESNRGGDSGRARP